MISHTSLGTNDLPRAERFYDALLPGLGGSKLLRTDRAVFYSFGEGLAKLAISKPFNGEPASNGNGTMVALSADGEEHVKTLHARALALGATCEGEPGPRQDGLYFGAYFRDLDGNKFAIFHLLRDPEKSLRGE